MTSILATNGRFVLFTWWERRNAQAKRKASLVGGEEDEETVTLLSDMEMDSAAANVTDQPTEPTTAPDEIGRAHV